MNPLGRCLVTGVSGVVGAGLLRHLLSEGEDAVGVVGTRLPPADLSARAVDLRERTAVREALRGVHTVFHAAARVGTAVYKASNPATVFAENLTMTLNVLDAAVQNDVKRVVYFSSAEIYAAAREPFEEDEGFLGSPPPGPEGYIWAKRMCEKAGEFFSRQYGIGWSVLRPNNVYGPDEQGDDNGRVVAVMCAHALRGEDIVLWGDGSQRRSFLFSSDLARAARLSALHGVDAGPVNVAGSEETTLSSLAELVIELAGTRSRVVCDQTKPSGAPTRRVDTSRARALLGFEPRVTLRDGIRSCLAARANAA